MDIYLDTSAFLSVIFGEPGWESVDKAMEGAVRVFTAGLLEAEAFSAVRRRSMDPGILKSRLGSLHWVHPDRSLTREIGAVLEKGPTLRGADLWHIACALYLAQDIAHLAFLTLDGEQASAAAKIGFKVLPDGWWGGVHEDGVPYRTVGLPASFPSSSVTSPDKSLRRTSRRKPSRTARRGK
jgi:predicted nucleic acid-binding protein